MSLRPNARTEVRRSKYKVAVDADEGRRRREDNMVEIRKNRREENLQKKRREGVQAPQLKNLSSTTVQLEQRGKAYEESGKKWYAKDIGITERACKWMSKGS